MTETIFFRLLQADDKADALAAAIAATHDGGAPADVYAVNSQSFGQIPGSPFAYWISNRIRQIFSNLPVFETDTRVVRVGIQTGDDFRFIRIWWEAAAQTILDACNAPNRHDRFDDWCRRRTHEGRTWVPVTKGGSFIPFYSDVSLVLNWKNNGCEINNFYGVNGSLRSRPQNSDFYFRPGLTYTYRTHRLAVQPLPAGTIPSVRGSGIYAPTDQLEAVSGLFSSFVFDYLVKVLLGRFNHPQFDMGDLCSTPVPVGFEDDESLKYASRESVRVLRDLDSANECSHAFVVPSLVALHPMAVEAAESVLRNTMERAHDVLLEWQTRLDNRVLNMYGLSNEDRDSILLSVSGSMMESVEDEINRPASEPEDEPTSQGWASGGPSLVAELFSWAVGCAFGRWDARVALDPSLAPKLQGPFEPLPVCSPGMLVGPDGMPARPDGIASEAWLRARPDAITLPPDGSVNRSTIPDAAYPLGIDWDGIMVDDDGHPDDIVGRVRDVLELIWGDRAGEIEREVCQMLGVRELRDYIRKPAGFFTSHLKRYSKSRRQAPIYWPFSTASGSYTLWVYYHRLSSDTLYTAVNRYVDPKIEAVARTVREAEDRLTRSAGREATALRGEIERGRNFLRELRDLRDELLRVAALPYQPNLDDGVIINAAPLWKLFRLSKWSKDTKAIWQKLECGDYDWAHLAYTLWPDRVREKCGSDKALAIAHGLEALYVAQPTPVRRRGGRKPTRASLDGTSGGGE